MSSELKLPALSQAAKEQFASAIAEQANQPLTQLLAQRLSKFLSFEAKPGYIELPTIRQIKPKDSQSYEAKRESIRQIIMNRERDITIEEARMLGFRGEAVDCVDSYNKITGKITLNTESMGGSEKGQLVLSELVSEKLETAKLLKKEIKPLDIGGERIRYVFDDGSSFQSRSLGKSGHFKIDIWDTVNNIEEKITFK